MSVKFIPVRLNGLIAGSAAFVLLFQLFLLPLWLLPISGWWALLIVPFIPLNNTLWSLIHEAIHKHLHPDSRINDGAGRVLSIMLGTSFHVLRFAHLMHHRFNRDWESEYYYPDRTPTWKARAGHYFTLTGGLFYMEVLTSLAAMLPYYVVQRLLTHHFTDETIQQAALRYAFHRGNIDKACLDSWLVVMLYSAAFIVYGSYWPILVGLIMARALIISMADNAYHYGTPADNSIPAKELHVPVAVSLMLLHFNHHLTHHLNQGACWLALRPLAQQQNIAYNTSLWRAIWEQFRGPIAVGQPASRAVYPLPQAA